MKKFLKFVFTLVIIVALICGVYFIFFMPVNKHNLFAQTQELVSADSSSNVGITEINIKEMKVVLETNDTQNAGSFAHSYIDAYLQNSNYYNIVISYTNKNVLFADKIESYRKEMKNSYKTLVSNYDKCSQYIKDYYLKIENRTNSAIPEQDKGALVNYINNFVELLKELENAKIQFCKYLCLCQSNSYNNNLNQTPLNSLYLELSGISFDYYNKQTTTVNDTEYTVNMSAINSFITKIDSDKNLYFDNLEEYEELLSIKNNIDYKGLTVAYVLGYETEFLNKIVSVPEGQQVSAAATEKYNNSVKFLNGILK